MKILIFNGSPRKRGNTEVLLKKIAAAAQENGHLVEIIRLAGRKISPCRACGGCEKKGVCVLEDDMVPIYDKLNRATRIIIGSPIYFYGVSAQAKIFIDRTQAMWCRKYLLTPKEERKNDPGRKGFFVGVAATRGKNIFSGALLTVKYCFDALGISYGGELLVRGVDKRGEVAGDMKEMARAREFGRLL